MEKKFSKEFDTDLLNSFVGIDIAGAASPKESATAVPDSPCSPAETDAVTATAAPSNEQQEQTQHQSYQHQTQYQQQHAVGNIATAASQVAEDSGALCEMRRTPPQNKGKFLLLYSNTYKTTQ